MITMLDAIIIATREDIVAAAGGPCKNSSEHPEFAGKFCGWITLGEKDNYRALLSTDPVFDTEKEAIDSMRTVVEKCKKLVQEELGDNSVEAVMKKAGCPDEESRVVAEVVHGVRG